MAVVQTIVNAVHANALLALAVFPGLTFEVGRTAMKDNASPPRVVWVPTGGTIEATDYVGARRVVGPPAQRARAVRVRVQRFAVHCWGTDFAQAEDLLDAVVAATWQEARAFASFGSFEFFGQQDGTADYAIRGEKAVVEVTFHVPIRDVIAQTTALTMQDHTGNFHSDLTSPAGELTGPSEGVC